MTLRVVGPGLGRTGTYSLKLALERLLGGRCHHMAEVLADRERQLGLWAPALRGEKVNWADVFAGYVAQIDLPGGRVLAGDQRGVPTPSSSCPRVPPSPGTAALHRPSFSSTATTGHHRSAT